MTEWATAHGWTVVLVLFLQVWALIEGGWKPWTR